MVIKTKNIGDKTMKWMSAFLLVMFIIYGLVSLGKVEWINWIAVVFGIFISVFLFTQAEIVEYYRKKDYRKLNFGDVIVHLSVALALVIAVNSVLLINLIKEQTPEWIVTFTSSVGVSAAVLGAIIAIVHLFSPRFR